MSRVLQLLTSSILLVLFWTACTTAPDASPPMTASTLKGEWTIERIGGAPVSNSSRAFIAFADGGQLSGNTGVNQISGTWSLDAQALSLSQLVSTMKAGTPELMSEERRLLTALGLVQGVQLSREGNLVLVSSEGLELACGSRRDVLDALEKQATLSGSVTYRERIALRPGHRLVVELQDVSRADAPAIVLGRLEAVVSGQVPFAFEVSYDPSQVKKRHRYSLRATLLDASGRLAWTTTQVYAVLTAEDPTEGIKLLLQRVP